MNPQVANEVKLLRGAAADFPPEIQKTLKLRDVREKRKQRRGDDSLMTECDRRSGDKFRTPTSVFPRTT